MGRGSWSDSSCSSAIDTTTIRLALILQSDWIFVAQTINHRCQTTNIMETLDIEAEDGVECGVARLVLGLSAMNKNDELNQNNASGEKSS